MNKYKIELFVILFLLVYAITIFLMAVLYVNIRLKGIEEHQKRQLEVNEYILNKIGG